MKLEYLEFSKGVSMYDLRTRLIHIFWICSAFGILILDVDLASAKVSRCVGWAFVNPAESGHFGRIYISAKLGDKRKFRRKGYLPSGVVVSLSPPTVGTSKDFSSRWCKFSYRGVVKGQIDRNGVDSLSDFVGGLRIDMSQVYGLASPANPNNDKPMEILERPDSSSAVAKLRRDNRLPVLILKGESGKPVTLGNYLQVHYVEPGVGTGPDTIRTGYLNSRHERVDNYNGTYRVFKISPSSPKPNDDAGWGQWLTEFVTQFLKDPTDSLKIILYDGKNNVQELASLAGCQRTAKLNLKLEAEGGFKSTFLGFKATGSAELEWEIPADQAIQFGVIGDKHRHGLNLSGVVQCEDFWPLYLKTAQLAFDSSDNSNARAFTVHRQLFFDYLNENELLKPYNLDTKSRTMNVVNTIHPMLFVPMVNGDTTGFYYSLFDSIERYMFEDVFDSVEVHPDHQFTVVLLFVEALSQWRGSEIGWQRRYQ